MMYVTGDTHGGFSRLSSHNFPEYYDMTKNDYVIILGDFGGIWNSEIESESERWWLNWLDAKPFTTLFIDGNHENFEQLATYPEKEFHGGVVNEIRPSVLHLQRGYVYNLDNKKCFTFGGARSHDINGGILELDDPDMEKKQIAIRKKGQFYRINHLSWWKEEEPSQQEMDRGLQSLEEVNWDVDFVFTHDCPTSYLAQLYAGSTIDSYELTNYLESIKQKLTYKKWFFGHHHDNRNLPDKGILMYEQIIRIS